MPGNDKSVPSTTTYIIWIRVNFIINLTRPVIRGEPGSANGQSVSEPTTTMPAEVSLHVPGLREGMFSSRLV